jgi:hypothetical protein
LARFGWDWRYGIDLGLHRLLEELIEPGKEAVSWPQMAAILTVARFCAQPSELGIAEHWYERTALEDITLEQVGRRIGRWLGRYPAAAKIVSVEASHDHGKRATGLVITSRLDKGQQTDRHHGALLAADQLHGNRSRQALALVRAIDSG